MMIDRSKKIFLVANANFEHFVMRGDGTNNCGYDKSDRWEVHAMKYLSKGGQVVLLKTDQEIDFETVEGHLFEISKGANPEDFGYSIDRIFNKESDLE